MTPMEQEGFIPEYERESDPSDFDRSDCDDDCCPFCDSTLESRPVLPNCDDAEIYCPECGYTGEIG